MADPKWPIDFSVHEKEILIKIMTDFGYGRHTTMDELDYKFFEDVRAEHIIFDLVREIAALREFKAAALKSNT